jgi:hypothetical protein
MTLFLKDLIERAVKTFAQAALSGFIVASSNIVDLGSGEAWKLAAFAGVAAGLSALSSLASRNVGPDKQSPSVV